MVAVKTFKIDHWSQSHSHLAKIRDLIDSCVSPLSIAQLTALGDGSEIFEQDRPLAYGPTRGSQKLREHIAALLSQARPAPVTWEDVLVTTGTIGANFLVLDTLTQPGDHIICQYPTYQQLYDVPRRAGAEVSLWRMQEDKGWTLNLAELESLVKPNTKMIIINNPANPVGAVLPRSTVQKIVDFAAERNLIVLADEVFAPLFHTLKPDDAEYPHSILSYGYANVISTGSVSKCFSLPGARVGWIATPVKSVIDMAVRARDYTTITVSQLDDQLAAFALEPKVCQQIVDRSLAICKTNIEQVEAFVQKNADVCTWVKPIGAGTAFVKVTKGGVPVDDAAFAEDLLKTTGVMVIPGGHAFGTEAKRDLQGYIRISLVCDAGKLLEGLNLLSGYIQKTCR